MNNLILLTDSYKVTHWKQYPPDTEAIYSYFESRGGQFPKTLFFGLQYYLKLYLEGEVIKLWMIGEANKLFREHFGDDKLFNLNAWERIIKKHDGRLPVRIKAVPEGSIVNNQNVLMTIENTDPEFYWLTNYLETLLVQVWYPTTVATLSYYMRKMIDKYAEDTGDPNLVPFKLHDFGFRGVSSVESAMTGGLAHLLNFMGTDTIASLVCAKQYYNAKDCPGFSIPAAEHSTMTSWGQENEAKAMENMLDQYPSGLVACVSDSYDIYHACERIWGEELKNKVLNREGCLVIRPDSGDPVKVVCKVLEILGKAFGSTVNDKGFKVLNPKVRIIQGDGCDYKTCDDILNYMRINRWSTDNIAFGMGGALLQKLHRDTQQFAFKCSAIKRKGQWHDVWKKPVTDSGKYSKKGRLQLVRVDGKSYSTVNHELSGREDKLVTVFENGEIVKEYTFEECRKRVINTSLPG